MRNRSLKRTLITYLAFALLITSVLAIVITLAEYTPSTTKPFQRFAIGSIVLNSVLWCLLLTVTGSLSLLNLYDPVKGNLLISMLSFLLLPAVVGATVLMVFSSDNLPGFVECFISFLIVQAYFFVRFRSCLKKIDSIAFE